jgi:TetR/AcrR family transcriptional regulator, regulator of autoinduction and epiphytic fitness
MGEMDGDTLDGRTLRRTRNRTAVLDAVLELFEGGSIEPSVDEVAARAGVSNRSIYRYFEDRDGLVRAAVAHALNRYGPEMLLEQSGVGSFEERVDHFVDHRLHVYSAMAPITRAAKVAAFNEPTIAHQFEIGRLNMRQQFLDHFAAELSPLAPGMQTRVVTAAELPFQFESFEFLRRSTNGMFDEMRTILVDLLTMCLGRFRASVA